MAIKFTGFGSAAGNGCGCCVVPGCNHKFCIFHCGGTSYPYTCGGTLNVKSGGTTIATGTVDSSGCITLDIAATGVYTVQFIPSGSNYQTYSASVSLDCQTATPTNIILAPASGYMCCAGGAPAIPTTLTDGNGTHPITTVTTGTGFVCRQVCYTTPVANTWGNATPACGCTAPGTNAIWVLYAVQLCAGNNVSVTRYWGEDQNCGAQPTAWRYKNALQANGTPYACGAVTNWAGSCQPTFPNCLTSLVDNIGASSGSASVGAVGCSTSASPTISLTPSAGNHLADPVGGSVVLS
jgi:hypothetical protein